MLALAFPPCAAGVADLLIASDDNQRPRRPRGPDDHASDLRAGAQASDRRRHGEAFDALMADAVPSAASIMMRADSDRPEGSGVLDMPAVSGGSGHSNEPNRNL
jgi:hypothetical protein